MPEPWCDGLTRDQEVRIRKAVESTCELCREYLPYHNLTFHGIPAKKGRMLPDPRKREQNILVVCEPCHRLIHAEPLPVKKLRARIAARAFHIRQEIRSALGYIPKPIVPPDNQDFARVYDDTIREFAGHYR